MAGIWGHRGNYQGNFKVIAERVGHGVALLGDQLGWGDDSAELGALQNGSRAVPILAPPGVTMSFERVSAGSCLSDGPNSDLMWCFWAFFGELLGAGTYVPLLFEARRPPSDLVIAAC